MTQHLNCLLMVSSTTGSDASGVLRLSRPARCPPEHLSPQFQVPELPGRRGPIDPDTPDWAVTKTSLHDGSKPKLVFSDELNDERTLYLGDDPFCEAVNLHCWKTGNPGWYDPAAITTKDRALKITLSKKESHDLNYQGSMVTGWNQFRFTRGYFEVGVILPGLNGVAELWPIVWVM